MVVDQGFRSMVSLVEICQSILIFCLKAKSYFGANFCSSSDGIEMEGVESGELVHENLRNEMYKKTKQNSITSSCVFYLELLCKPSRKKNVIDRPIEKTSKNKEWKKKKKKDRGIKRIIQSSRWYNRRGESYK